MDKDQIKKALETAYAASPEAKAAYDAWRAKMEEVVTLRARAMEADDKAIDLLDAIDIAEEELDRMAVKSATYEAIKKKRQQVRELRSEQKGLRAWSERLDDEARKTDAEARELKRQLDETIHGGRFESGLS